MAELGRRNDVDPLVSYSFSVDMDGGEVARFSGVDGLAYEQEMIEYRESDRPNVINFRQGRKKPIRVTFKRGFLVNYNQKSDFFDWIRECENGAVKPRNLGVTVGHYGPSNVAEADANTTWELNGCYPTKWSLGSLDGNSSSCLIESLEVVVSSIGRK